MKPIKTSWKDISVGDFQRIYDLEKKGDEEKLLELIALVNGVDMDEVLNMPISKLEAHYDDIDFLGKEPKSVLIKPFYTINDTRYNVHGADMTTAQYIDFKQMVPTYSENLAQFLTVFLIPAGHKYNDGYDLEKARQDISSMSIVDARAVAAFFLTRFVLLMKLFLRSSERRARRMERKAKTEEEKEILRKLREEMERTRRLLPLIGSTSLATYTPKQDTTSQKYSNSL